MIYRLTAVAAHTDPTAGYWIVGGLAALWLLAYPVACLIWPYGKCRSCGGSGRRHATFGGKGFRYCRRCKGSGARLRIGRRIFNHLHVMRKDAK